MLIQCSILSVWLSTEIFVDCMLVVFLRQKWGGRAFSEQGTARAKALGPKKRQSKFRKCGANMGSRGGAGGQGGVTLLQLRTKGGRSLHEGGEEGGLGKLWEGVSSISWPSCPGKQCSSNNGHG